MFLCQAPSRSDTGWQDLTKMLQLLSFQLQLRGQTVATEIQAFNQEAGDLDWVLFFAWGIQTHITYLPGESCKNEAVGYLREQRQSKNAKGCSLHILPAFYLCRFKTEVRWIYRFSVGHPSEHGEPVSCLTTETVFGERTQKIPQHCSKSWPSAYSTKLLFHLLHEFQCLHKRGTTKWVLTMILWFYDSDHCSGNVWPCCHIMKFFAFETLLLRRILNPNGGHFLTEV